MRSRLASFAVLTCAILVGVGALAWWNFAQRQDRIRLPTADHARHLVLIVLDTVRADRLSAYGHHRETTPFLEQLAGNSVVFEHAKAPAPWTVPSHASMFTGLWPAQHQAQWGRFTLAKEHTTLAEVLAAEGFHTVGLSANAFLAPENGFAQGFQHYEVFGGSLRTRSDRIVQQLEHHLDPDRRNFLFLNFLDAHIPYNTAAYGHDFGVERPGGPVHDSAVKWAISAGDRPFPAEEREQHQAAYDAAIRAVDDVVRSVFSRLEKLGMLHSTLVVITSDHGDGLGAHQIIGHSASTWEEQLAIPLLLHYPRALSSERVPELRSTTHLASTAVDWLGLPRPTSWSELPTLFDSEPKTSPTGLPASRHAVSADYRSYFSSEEADSVNARVRIDHPALVEAVQHTHVLYCDRFKLAVRPLGAPTLFDLELDPHEQDDLWDESLPAARQCFADYRRLREAGRFTDFAEVVTEAQREAAEAARDDERLRALGYLQ